MSAPRYLVFETGGTKLIAGLAGAGGRLIAAKTLRRGPNDRAQDSLRRLFDAAKELLSASEPRPANLWGVGFGYGGGVNRACNRVLVCLHEEGWEDIDVEAEIEAAFGLPAAIENDCKLAALAEACHGAGCGSRTVLYVTLGTGVGGGLVRDGSIVELSPLGEAEIGHIVVAPDGPLCACGGRGCLEAVCSGPGMARLATVMAEDEPQASGRRWDSKELIESWRRGEPFGSKVVQCAAGYLALGLAAGTNLFAPDVVVVGGGIGSGNPDYVALAASMAREKVVPYFRARFRAVPSALGESAVTQGAAILAQQRFGGGV